MGGTGCNRFRRDGERVSDPAAPAIRVPDAIGYVKLNGDIYDMAPTASGLGCYMLGNDSGVFSFGDTRFYGSTAGTPVPAPVEPRRQPEVLRLRCQQPLLRLP